MEMGFGAGVALKPHIRTDTHSHVHTFMSIMRLYYSSDVCHTLEIIVRDQIM